MKSRIVGQALPSDAVPRGGTISWPFVTAALAAVMKAGALQYATCVKRLPPEPFTHLALVSVSMSLATNVRLLPWNPNQIATMAFAGSVGTIGGAAAFVPLSM